MSGSDNTMGVIFDMDGVIVDSNPVHKKAIQKFCESYDIQISDSYLKEKVYGRTNSEWVPKVFGVSDKRRIKKLSDQKEQLFRQIFDPQKWMTQGLLPFIHELKAEQIPLGVATSAPVENERYILSELGIRDDFEVILHAAHVSRSKPAPDIYLKAAERLGLETSHCVVFEDSIPGAEAALNAGCFTIGVTSTYSSGDLERCHRNIGDFTEVDVKKLRSWITSYFPEVI